MVCIGRVTVSFNMMESIRLDLFHSQYRSCVSQCAAGDAWWCQVYIQHEGRKVLLHCRQVWVITGDKQETAINIAISCKLILHPDRLMICNADNYDSAPATARTACRLRWCLSCFPLESTCCPWIVRPAVCSISTHTWGSRS